MGAKRCRRGWRSAQPDLAAIGPWLREAGFIGSAADPVSGKTSFDAAGQPRRLHARYANGWTCTVHFTLDGGFSLSQSLRVRVCAVRAGA